MLKICRLGEIGARRAAGSVSASLLATFIVVAVASSAQASGAAVVPLGTASGFAILAGTGITNTGLTTITDGDVGSSPVTTVSGTAPVYTNSTDHGGDPVTVQAKVDMAAAVVDATAQGSGTPIAVLGGQTLTPGVYSSAAALDLTGTLTLDGQNLANPVFLIKAGTSLTTAASSDVLLINGATSCNVFWQFGASATLGANSTFRGTILAGVSITVGAGVTVDGRLLAQGGTVTLDSDAITVPNCTPVTTTTTTTTTTTLPPTTTTLTTTTTTLPVTTTTLPSLVTTTTLAITTSTMATVDPTTTTTAPDRRPMVSGAHHLHPSPALHAFGLTG